MFKTYIPKEPANEWLLIDAAGQNLGRLATKIATYIRGKHKPHYTPHLLCGDFVVVINADKVVLSGTKLDNKMYKRYSGYQSGLKEETARRVLDKNPERTIEHAVFGMLPKNRLGRKLRTRLKVYGGSAHPHSAQMPQLENK